MLFQALDDGLFDIALIGLDIHADGMDGSGIVSVTFMQNYEKSSAGQNKHIVFM